VVRGLWLWFWGGGGDGAVPPAVVAVEGVGRDPLVINSVGKG
jgi:hypothetical protein